MAGDYGECVVKRLEFGGLLVQRADFTIGISAELLAQADDGISTDERGHLVIAGQVVYRPDRFDLGGRVVVCERVG